MIASLAAAISVAVIWAKSFRLQHLAVGDGETRVGFEFRRLRWLPRARKAEPPVPVVRRALVLLFELGAGGSMAESWSNRFAAPKENAECLLEQERMLVPFHEYRMQYPIEVPARCQWPRSRPPKAHPAWPGSDGNPGPRNARAKWTRLSASRPPSAGIIALPAMLRAPARSAPSPCCHQRARCRPDT